MFNMLASKCFVFIAFFIFKARALADLNEVFAWKELLFAWPSEDAKNTAIKNGDYFPANNLPLGMEIWKDKLFITIPRWKSGVPTSLGYIFLKETHNKTPAIIPYPNWQVNAVPKEEVKEDDNRIISTFRIAVDACDRLWVMDVGVVDLVGENKVFSSPAILIYDLNTDKLIKKYVLDSKVIKEGRFFEGSFFPNIVIDSNKDQCEDAYAYIPDVSRYGLIVYSLKNNKSWRFEHHFFHFDPLQGNFNSGGINFQWSDGIFGLTLGPTDQNGFRTTYFHPSASLNEFSVNTAVLKNETLTSDPKIYDLFKLEGNKGKETQTTCSVFDQKSNTIFLAQLNRDGVACWNPRCPLVPENVALVAQDHEKLIFTNEIRIDAERNLWILSNKMPKFLYDHLNEEEINYRMFKVKVDDAIAETPCAA